ncbi:MAG: hypothetical protein ACLRVT_08330 [Oscillospiraceae bacterium]
MAYSLAVFNQLYVQLLQLTVKLFSHSSIPASCIKILSPVRCGLIQTVL